MIDDDQEIARQLWLRLIVAADQRQETSYYSNAHATIETFDWIEGSKIYWVTVGVHERLNLVFNGQRIAFTRPIRKPAQWTMRGSDAALVEAKLRGII